jgi:RNA polymerase sigma-70 factor, ECF subfamily
MAEKVTCDHPEPPDNGGDLALRIADFVRLLSSCERRLHSYVVALVGNLADADEIVQETNLRLWVQFDQYRPGTDFGSWACTIAYYEVLSFRKRSARRTQGLGDDFLAAISAEVQQRSDELDARQLALGACLEKLPAADRTLVLKCYTGKATMQDIAAGIGRTVTATYQALWRIRNNLRRCIQQQLHLQEGRS